MPARGRIVVSDLYCKGCEICVVNCPQQVIGLDPDRITAKGYHPAVLIADGCTGCAICALVCPDSAIMVFREDPRARRAEGGQS